MLQFEVIAHRLRDEYRVDASWEPVEFTCARWLSGMRRSPELTSCIRNLAHDARQHWSSSPRVNFRFAASRAA